MYGFVCLHYPTLDYYNCIKSRDSSPLSPGKSQLQHVISEPPTEFVKTVIDLTTILQDDEDALKKLQAAFEHIAHCMESETYISIVQSEDYKSVDSVRALFRLLAPHLKPIDCSLLQALIKAAGIKQAIQRLDEYLRASNSYLLGNGSEKVHVPCEPHEMETSSENDLVNSQPIADSTSVPIAIKVAKNEMNWGDFRWIKDLFCGICGFPLWTLQYDENTPGCVVIKCITSIKMLSHIRSTLLDDGDMHLLHCEKIVSIQVGKDYTIIVGNHDYWMVSNNNNTHKAAIALLPSTTHPQSWAEPHIHTHTGISG